jgi:predicted small metal-binding protein
MFPSRSVRSGEPPKQEESVEQSDTSQPLRVGCACGWEVVGTEAEVVPAVLEHGERVHNMSGTPEQVLANAERIDASGGDQLTDR